MRYKTTPRARRQKYKWSNDVLVFSGGHIGFKGAEPLTKRHGALPSGVENPLKFAVVNLSLLVVSS